MTPAMCGLAIEVPEIVSVRVPTWIPDASKRPVHVLLPDAAVVQVMPVWTEVMLDPGAAMSGFSRSGEPKMRRGPRELKLATVSAPGRSDTLSVAILAFIVFASAYVTMTDGIVIVASTPAMPPNAPAAEFAMSTPMAPAFWAFFTFTANPHVPRSIIAMFPATAAEFVIAEQPSVVSGPAPSAASSARTTLPVVPASGGTEPNCAAPAA